MQNLAILLLIAAAAGALLHRLSGGRLFGSVGRAAAVAVIVALGIALVSGIAKVGDARASFSNLIGSFETTSEMQTSEKSVPAREGGTLTVDIPVGSIEVETGASDAVHVTAYRSGAFIEHLEWDLTESEGGTVLSARDNSPSGFRLGRSSARFVVTVPEKYSVDARTRGGGITVGDLHGHVKVYTSGGSLKIGEIVGAVEGRTSGGSVRLGGATGDAMVRTSGGSLRIGRVGGALDAQTSGGSITLEDVGGSVKAHTSGGSITCNLTRPLTDGVSLRTSGGSIRVRLADGIGANVNASTSAGRVQSAFHPTGERRSSLRDVINGGGPELSLRTSAGSINIDRLE